MKLNTLVLFLFAASSIAAIGCGTKKKSSTTTNPDTNIVAGSNDTLHDGQSGPVYTDPHPAECGNCPIADTTPVDGCAAVIGTSVPCEGTCFVDSNVTTTYYNNPPTSGPEYDFYDYNFYDVANLPRGEYVRNLYHGYVVIAYNCTNCNTMLDQLTPYGTVPPTTGTGGTPVPGYGVIVTQDTALPENSFYALSWTWSYNFTTFDQATLECFIKQHYGHGPDASDPNAATNPNATN